MKGCDKANTVVQSRPYSVTGSRAVKSLFMANRDCSYYVDKYSYTQYARTGVKYPQTSKYSKIQSLPVHKKPFFGLSHIMTDDAIPRYLGLILSIKFLEHTLVCTDNLLSNDCPNAA